MMIDQPAYLVDHILRELQPPHYSLRKQTTALGVTLEMSVSSSVDEHTVGLSEVVEQHCKAYLWIGQRIADRLADMRPHIEFVVTRLLFKPDTRFYLGQHIF